MTPRRPPTSSAPSGNGCSGASGSTRRSSRPRSRPSCRRSTGPSATRCSSVTRLVLGGYGPALGVVDLGPEGFGPPVEVAAAASPSFVVASADGRFVYAALEGDDGQVGAWAVTDELPWPALGQQPTGGAAPCHLAISPDGRWLATANYLSGSVSVHPVLDDGSLGVQNGSRRASRHTRSPGRPPGRTSRAPGGVRRRRAAGLRPRAGRGRRLPPGRRPADRGRAVGDAGRLGAEAPRARRRRRLRARGALVDGDGMRRVRVGPLAAADRLAPRAGRAGREHCRRGRGRSATRCSGPTGATTPSPCLPGPTAACGWSSPCRAAGRGRGGWGWSTGPCSSRTNALTTWSGSAARRRVVEPRRAGVAAAPSPDLLSRRSAAVLTPEAVRISEHP